MLNNIGEGIAIFGVMLGFGMTGNYFLLFLLILPVFTWLRVNDDEVVKENEYKYMVKDLEILKVQQELRLLRNKK